MKALIFDLDRTLVDTVYAVGLLTGGYGEDELISAGAFRVDRGADELPDAIDELGI